MQIAHALGKFILQLQADGRSLHTIKQYQRHVHAMACWLAQNGRHVQMEERFPLHVRRALEDRGHEVDVLKAWSTAVGGSQGIQFDAEQGVFQGGADPRRDGQAMGF